MHISVYNMKDILSHIADYKERYFKSQLMSMFYMHERKRSNAKPTLTTICFM